MVLISDFVKIDGSSAKEWKEKEQYHIYTETKFEGKTFDLVFLSGQMTFKHQSFVDEWVRDTLVFAFRDLRWSTEIPIKVVPAVSPASFASIDIDETRSLGWAVDSTRVQIIGGEGQPASRVIQLTCDVAVQGIDSHLNRVTYYVVAMGKRIK